MHSSTDQARINRRFSMGVKSSNAAAKAPRMKLGILPRRLSGHCSPAPMVGILRRVQPVLQNSFRTALYTAATASITVLSSWAHSPVLKLGTATWITCLLV